MIIGDQSDFENYTYLVFEIREYSIIESSVKIHTAMIEIAMNNKYVKKVNCEILQLFSKR